MAGKWNNYIPPEEEEDDEDKFVPLISLDKTFPENDFKYLGNVDEVQEQLSDELDERAQALEIIKFTKRTTIRVKVEKGTEEAKIEEGTIFVITNQVKITKVTCNDLELTQDEIESLGEQDYSFELFEVKYDDTIDIEVSPYRLGDNAYSNAYILFSYENNDYVKLRCGKIGFTNTSKVGKRLVTNIEGLPLRPKNYSIPPMFENPGKTIKNANLYKNPGGMCFAVTMARVNRAYVDTWETEVLELTNFRTKDYYYSGTTAPSIPDNYIGYGVASALHNKGYADLVTPEDVWGGNLEEGAVLQYWNNSKNLAWNILKQAIKDRLIVGYSSNYEGGHSVVFKTYIYDDSGNITGLKFYDYSGTDREPYNKNKPVIFLGGNLKDIE